MSDASGLSWADVAILRACADVHAVSRGPYVKTLRVLGALHERGGLGTPAAYESLLDLARPWVVHLRLVEVHGNIGSPSGFGPADPAFTECRLTPLGEAVLAAEDGTLGRLPIGLINGDAHVGGGRAPLDPGRVVAAIRAVSGAADADVLGLLGGPAFPTGCEVDVDLEAWSSGASVGMTLTARIESGAAGRVVISCLPPGCTADAVVEAISLRETLVRGGGSDVPMFHDVRDESTGDDARVAVELLDGADPDTVVDVLTSLDCILRTIVVGAGGPVVAAVRSFADSDRDALAYRLATIEAAIGS